MHLTVIEDALV